jgi:hypothetical protein
MSGEERQDALKVIRAFNENRDASSFSRGRSGRSRGNRTVQRPKTDKSEAEANIAEITSGGVSYFNANGVMSTKIGQSVLTTVALLLVLYSC